MNSTKNIDYVKRINTLGKVSKIILIIMRIFCIVGIVVTIVSGIFCIAVLPSDSTAITSKGSASYEFIVDTAKLPSYVEIESGVDIGEDNLDTEFEFLGTEFSIKDIESEDDGIEKYTFDAHYNAKNSTLFKYGVAGVCFAAALYIVFTLIVVIFAGKLAKALEKCQSPFEESVTKAMKHFALSLIIPFVFMIAENGILNLSLILAILAVIIFSYIFSYGAKLQQESDETL